MSLGLGQLLNLWLVGILSVNDISRTALGAQTYRCVLVGYPIFTAVFYLSIYTALPADTPPSRRAERVRKKGPPSPAMAARLAPLSAAEIAFAVAQTRRWAAGRQLVFYEIDLYEGASTL